MLNRKKNQSKLKAFLKGHSICNSGFLKILSTTMECLLGIQGKDFVILAGDTVSSRSIMKMKSDQDKIFKIGSRMMMAAVGQAGDTVMFTELIGKNLQLYKMKNGYEMSLHAAVNFTRRILAEMLRSQKPKMVNLLMAGVDEGGPALYFIDYIATMVKLPFAVHGYGGMFTMSILDKYYKPGMQRTEALNLLKMCMNEIQTRFVIDTPRFMVRVVTAKGVEDLGLVDPKAKGTI